MTIEQYLDKYDSYIRGLIYKRADSDYRDDAYQEVVMAIIKYKDKLDSLPNDKARLAYICTITKHTAFPSKQSDKKLKTYGDFTRSDDDDATDPEEWFLEDNTYAPDNKVDLAKRAWAEEIIDTNELLKEIKKTVNKIRTNYCLNPSKIWHLANRERHAQLVTEWQKNNPDRVRKYAKKYKTNNHYKILEQQRKYRETHREQLRAYGRLYKLKRKEQKNEQLGNIK